MDESAPGTQRRYAEVDALKAVSIVVVVLIHSMRSSFASDLSPLERWIGLQTRFAVPGFLMASGFLYAASERSGLSVTLRRLRRVLVPYLVASLLAQGWSLSTGTPTPTGSFLVDLLFGSSFGPYYYVFVIAMLVVATPLFARIGGFTIVLAAALALAQWQVVAGDLGSSVDPYWRIRSPLLWWAYFLFGWLVRKRYVEIAPRVARNRGVVLAILLGSVGVLATATFAAGSQRVVLGAAWLEVYAVTAVIFAAACGRPSPRPLRALSDATYPIYLLHLFFVYELARHVPPRQVQTDPLWVACSVVLGLAGSLALIAISRRLLGPRSRAWIGA